MPWLWIIFLIIGGVSRREDRAGHQGLGVLVGRGPRLRRATAEIKRTLSPRASDEQAACPKGKALVSDAYDKGNV